MPWNAPKELPRHVRISKALCWVLRHEGVGLGLDVMPDGYVALDQVMNSPVISKFKSAWGGL